MEDVVGELVRDRKRGSLTGHRHKAERLNALSDRMVAGFRLLLAGSALLAVCIDPSEPAYLVPLTCSALTFYTLYCATIYAITWPAEAFSKTWLIVLMANDILVYSVLISLSGGANSIFLFFYFVPIIAACSFLGPAAGIVVTLTCALLFAGLGYAITPAAELEWNRFLLRPIYLVVLGYILTTWSTAEVRLKRRLALLNEVFSISNPRFGVDQTIGQFMRRIMDFFDADTCVFLQPDRQTKQHRVRCASRNDPAHGDQDFQASGEIKEVLPALAQPLISVYRTKLHLARRYPKYLVSHPQTQKMTERPASEARALLEWLGARSFMTAALTQHQTSIGYVCISSSRRRQFG